MDRPTVYVFGHGNLPFATFLERYVPAIDTMLLDQATAWVVCDFRGTDTLAMEYLKTRTDRATVFHVGERPRYMPDTFGTPADGWQRRGGFADDATRDDAALAACTHFLAIDARPDETRASGTRRAIERCRALGRIDLAATATTPPLTGAARAHALIDTVDPTHATARSFAHILVSLFPPWFDFAPHHFAVLAWDLGLHLVIAGPSPVRAPTIGVISTSDSRNLKCATLTTFRVDGRVADIQMHYAPSDEHRARAATEIASMLDQLYPARPQTP
jgi:hypothetical protein